MVKHSMRWLGGVATSMLQATGCDRSMSTGSLTEHGLTHHWQECRSMLSRLMTVSACDVRSLHCRLKQEDFGVSASSRGSMQKSRAAYSGALVHHVDDDDVHGLVKDGHADALHTVLMRCHVSPEVRNKVRPDRCWQHAALLWHVRILPPPT
jgi:hypothetical protein